MTIFEPGDLVRVPFPHVERAVVVARPALVLAIRDPEAIEPLLWVLMVTNAGRPDWRGDVPIADWRALGLRIPSKVRTAKVSTVEASRASRIGRINASDWRAVLAAVSADLPGTP